MVEKDKHQEVKGDLNQKISGTLSIETGADVQQKTASNYAHEVGTEAHLKANGKFIMEAGAELTLKVGGSFVKLDGGGVTIVGSQVKINSGGSAGSGSGASLKAPVDPLEAVNNKAGKVEKVSTNSTSSSQALNLPKSDFHRPEVRKMTAEEWEAAKQPAPVPEEEKHWLELEYQDAEGNGMADVEYTVLFADKSKQKGTLDKNGQARLDDVPPGAVQVIYGLEESPEEELKEQRAALKQTLDGMVSEVAQEAKYQNAQLEQENLLTQGLIYTGAFLSGLYESGEAMVSTLVTAATAADEIKRKALHAIFTGNPAALERELNHLKEMGEQVIDTTSEAYDTLTTLLSDPECRQMLEEFPQRYIGAHSSVEQVHMAGSLSFDIILAIITGGIGTAASAVSKSRYAVKAAQLLKNIAKLLKKTAKRLKVKGKTNTRITNRKSRSRHTITKSDVKSLELLRSRDSKLVEDALEKKRSNPDFDSLSDGEFVALHAYTRDYYSPMNQALRKNDVQLLDENGPFINSTSSALNKLSKIPGRVYKGKVFRGMNMDETKIHQLFPDSGIYVDKGFMSTSQDFDSAFSGKLKIFIDSKNGVSISDVSFYPDEKEILFKPGSTFKILNKTKTQNNDWYIFLEEM